MTDLQGKIYRDRDWVQLVVQDVVVQDDPNISDINGWFRVLAQSNTRTVYVALENIDPFNPYQDIKKGKYIRQSSIVGVRSVKGPFRYGDYVERVNDFGGFFVEQQSGTHCVVNLDRCSVTNGRLRIVDVTEIRLVTPVEHLLEEFTRQPPAPAEALPSELVDSSEPSKDIRFELVQSLLASPAFYNRPELIEGETLADKLAICSEAILDKIHTRYSIKRSDNLEFASLDDINYNHLLNSKDEGDKDE